MTEHHPNGQTYSGSKSGDYMKFSAHEAYEVLSRAQMHSPELKAELESQISKLNLQKAEISEKLKSLEASAIYFTTNL
jgi:hypothetical protein